MNGIQAGNADDVLKSICHDPLEKTFRSYWGLIDVFENMNGKMSAKEMFKDGILFGEASQKCFDARRACLCGMSGNGRALRSCCLSGRQLRAA